jgi:hypothetical protein
VYRLEVPSKEWMVLMFFDLRGEPTFACLCGCKMFNVVVMWSEKTREVGWYDLKQTCVECGSLSTAPTPIDEMSD